MQTKVSIICGIAKIINDSANYPNRAIAIETQAVEKSSPRSSNSPQENDREDKIGQRIDTLTVPFLAIRETVLNMLAHRSWWDESESLSVAIFEDRIEFTNPGHFPIGTSVEDFIEVPRSKPQNPDIANVLFRSGWMESWGRGIIKAPWVTRIVFKFKNPLVPYLSGKGGDGSSGEPINEPINFTNIQVKTTYDAIRLHPGISRSGIVAQTGLTLPSVKRYISKLIAKGYIEHRGSNKTGGYHPGQQALALVYPCFFRFCTQSRKATKGTAAAFHAFRGRDSGLFLSGAATKGMRAPKYTFRVWASILSWLLYRNIPFTNEYN